MTHLEQLFETLAVVQVQHANTTAALRARSESFIDKVNRHIDYLLGATNAPCPSCGSTLDEPFGHRVHLSSCPEVLVSLKPLGKDGLYCPSCRVTTQVDGRLVHLSGCLQTFETNIATFQSAGAR